jgi:hypothetical protein
MLIESIIRRPKGTKVDMGSAIYHFLPDADGRHVAEVEDQAHIIAILAIKEGYRPADGSVLAAASAVPVIEGPFFIVRGPQDIEAFGDWARAIPEMQDDPAEFVLLIDKIAAGEASLGGYAFPANEIPSPASASAGTRAARDTSPPPPPATTILPTAQSQQDSRIDGGSQSAGEGGAGAAGGAGSETAEEEDGEEEEEEAEAEASGELDREALAKEYSELVGHRPNGKWSAEKIAAAIAEVKAQG